MLGYIRCVLCSYHLSFSPLFPSLRFFKLGLESLCVSMLSVLVQDVHQIGDVTSSQSQSLDFRQLGVSRDVGNTLPQLRKSRVNTLSSPPLLTVGRGSPLHCTGLCVVVNTDRSPIHRNCAGPRN